MKTDASSRQGALPFPEATQAVGRRVVNRNGIGARHEGMAVPEGVSNEMLEAEDLTASAAGSRADAGRPGEARDFSPEQQFRRISLEGVSDASVAATKQRIRVNQQAPTAARRRTPVRPTQRLYTPSETAAQTDVTATQTDVQVERLPEQIAPERAITRERLTIELLLADPGRAVPVLLATFAFFAASLIF